MESYEQYMNINKTHMNINKKIKPVEHPDLVLKSPIAYHGDTDLSVIPINKDGIAVCLKCGSIGVKHSFYTKQRNFCSLQCARSYTGLANPQKDDGMDGLEEHRPHKKQVNYKFQFMESTDHLVGMIPMEPLPQLPGMWQPVIDDFMQQVPHKTGNLSNSYEWQRELFTNDFLAAPVSLFSHAPLASLWINIFEGMKVEVKNRDCENYSIKLSDYFWVATILKIRGYMGLLRYEGFGNDESKDFWVNILSPEVHPVGWCATRGKPLIPPQSLGNKYSNWKTFLVQQLTGTRSFPTDTYSKLSENLKSRFRIGHILEVVDKNRICQVKVATVHEIIGKRLHIKYYECSNDDNGFWCHEDCPLIHPVGWAREVGHLLQAPIDYLERLANGISDPDDTTSDMFKYYTKKDPHNINFEGPFIEGMKLEAIDPLNLSSICVATVMKVLSYGYIMIRIDCYPPDETGSDWFCYHENSPYIFPKGFCEKRGIPLTVAIGQPPTPTTLPEMHVASGFKHGFIPGMRLECVDLMDPRLVCVATISGVVGRLLKVHFNGWGEEYDQWLDCESTDIYPVGWCQVVGHILEGPFVPPTRQPPPPARKKGRKKKAIKASFHSDTQKSSQSSADTLCDISNSNDGVFEMMNTKSDESKTYSPNIETNDKPNVPNADFTCANEQDDLNEHMDFDAAIDEKFNSAENESEDSYKNFNEPETVPKEDIEKEEPRIHKFIPRLVGTTIDLKSMESIDPETWDPEDVAQFLSINDCAPYCLHFSEIDGKMMLELSKDEIIKLLNMKVGPSLKIFDLIGQLKLKLKPMHARNKLLNSL